MSGGFGYYDGDNYDENGDLLTPGTQNPPPQQQGNGLRDHLKKVEEQLKALREQNETLMSERRTTSVADALQAKGYDRQAAGLYGGDPAKLDDWLTTYGSTLAKAPVPTDAATQQQQGGAPTSTVPADGQAALQQMQQAGVNAAAPQGTEAEQIAQMRNMQDPAKLMEYLQGQGNQHYWTG